jgi:hypothetical protein
VRALQIQTRQFIEYLGVICGATRASEIVEVDIERGRPEHIGELLDEHAHGERGGGRRPLAPGASSANSSDDGTWAGAGDDQLEEAKGREEKIK